ncbi:hypothetical protein [Flectobacillus major]|uniref:hypothetical protein n=1 Tax=Flectobacillus major TaxID=103 RepID=UPI000478F368|nr:hypothetical protein [Flectobacillus major]
MEKVLDIFIFKTNINSIHQATLVYQALNLPEYIRVNIDLDDCDKILRVESTHSDSQSIIQTILSLGFTCEELSD